jgi:hypothetical protein
MFETLLSKLLHLGFILIANNSINIFSKTSSLETFLKFLQLKAFFEDFFLTLNK